YAASPPSFTDADGSNASATLPIPRFATNPRGVFPVLTVAGAQPPRLSIFKTHSGGAPQGTSSFGYNITLSKSPKERAPDGTPVTVRDDLPSGLTAETISGTGWSCNLTSLVCTRSDVLNPGSFYPPIIVTVRVGTYAASPQINTATVYGGGSASKTV